MIPWEFLDRGEVPGGDELRLYRRGEEFSIRVGGVELMNSRVYGSEDALAELACAGLGDRPRVRVLVGGLGVGYTLAAALRLLAPDAEVVVAELVPAVVRWNRGPLSHIAGHPLRDPRVRVREADVAQVMREGRGAYDAVMLDVDNGPDGLTRAANDWLYGASGLAVARDALRPRGVLAVWSAAADRSFVRRLTRAGFAVEEKGVRSRSRGRGSRHTIWLARP